MTRYQKEKGDQVMVHTEYRDCVDEDGEEYTQRLQYAVPYAGVVHVSADGCFDHLWLDPELYPWQAEALSEAGAIPRAQPLSDPESYLEALELMQYVRQFAPDIQLMLHLRFVRGWTLEEIGSFFGLGHNGVHQQEARALRILRDRVHHRPKNPQNHLPCYVRQTMGGGASCSVCGSEVLYRDVSHKESCGNRRNKVCYWRLLFCPQCQPEHRHADARPVVGRTHGVLPNYVRKYRPMKKATR
jgi:hypothetical protein